jgi:hypothetical protein
LGADDVRRQRRYQTFASRALWQIQGPATGRDAGRFCRAIGGHDIFWRYRASTTRSVSPGKLRARALRQPAVFFLLDQHLTTTALGTDADLGRINFELLVIGDLGTRGQGFPWSRVPVTSDMH